MRGDIKQRVFCPTLKMTFGKNLSVRTVFRGVDGVRERRSAACRSGEDEFLMAPPPLGGSTSRDIDASRLRGEKNKIKSQGDEHVEVLVMSDHQLLSSIKIPELFHLFF